MISPDTHAHVRGESPFTDDLPEPSGTLHGAVFGSPAACGKIRSLDFSEALAMPGVRAIFTAKDIPGRNQIGTIIEDEPLFAEEEVDFIGQPIAFVVAETADIARKAINKILIEIEEHPPVFDPREAFAKGSLIAPVRTFALGDTENAWSQCATIVTGRVDTGGQEHLYLETQSCLAIPEARGRLHLYSATQSPSAVQRVAARVLGCQMHEIEVEVQRLGGAFGGKEDQATPWAVMTALAARKLQRPVKLTLRRHEDMRMTGKRHPYSSDFKLGLDADGRFLSYEAFYYQNSGAAADLSTAIMERTLFHATNAYFIPNVRATAACCRTNLPPFTAFRGFGGPQAMFVMESTITAAAEKLGKPALELQRLNLLEKGDELPFGMKVQADSVRRSFDEATARFHIEQRMKEISGENKQFSFMKRGLAVMPVNFGISFTNTMLNQAGSLVHIYTDGSVSVSTAAVEMGQGVFTKIRRIAAQTLGISESRIRIESTSTSRVANMSPTAASTATDLNGAAVLMACRILNERLRGVASTLHRTQPDQIEIVNEQVCVNRQPVDCFWEDLVSAAYQQRVDLSAHAFYATPEIHFDKKTEKGQPFAYHVAGTAVIESVVDTLRGTAKIDSVRVVHDGGRSLDLLVDRGQAEGGIVQGIGWVTLEELVYKEGRLLSDSLTTYKVPDLHFAPEKLEVVFLENSEGPSAVMRTKAMGEPPFMYGIGAWFAIRSALRTVRELPTDLFQSPMTHEMILKLLEHPAENDDAEK